MKTSLSHILIVMNLLIMCASSFSYANPWHCLCYKEKYKGTPTEVTTCRSSAGECQGLAQKVKRGTSVLIANSQSRACTQVSGDHPATQMGQRSAWLPSKKPGAWWTPAGCLLPERERAKKSSETSLNTSLSMCKPEMDTHSITFKILSLKFFGFDPIGDDEPSDCDQEIWSGKAEVLEGGKALCIFEFSTTSMTGLTNTHKAREKLKRRFIGTVHQGSYDPTGQCWPELIIHQRAE